MASNWLCSFFVIIIQVFEIRSQLSSFYDITHTGYFVLRRVDDSADQVTVSSYNNFPGFPFMGIYHTGIYIGTNGLISFERAYTSYTPSAFPVSGIPPCLTAFWADVDTANHGNVGDIYGYETTDAAILADIDEDVNAVYRNREGDTPFRGQWCLVATWYQVTHYGASGYYPQNTFQMALITDFLDSFAVFTYGDIIWTYGTASGGIPAQIGFDAGDGINFAIVSESRTEGITIVSNTQRIYQVNSVVVTDPNVDECTSNPCQNLGTCEDMVGGYECNCRDGFTGDNCEQTTTTTSTTTTTTTTTVTTPIDTTIMDTTIAPMTTDPVDTTAIPITTDPVDTTVIDNTTPLIETTAIPITTHHIDTTAIHITTDHVDTTAILVDSIETTAIPITTHHVDTTAIPVDSIETTAIPITTDHVDNTAIPVDSIETTAIPITTDHVDNTAIPIDSIETTAIPITTDHVDNTAIPIDSIETTAIPITIHHDETTEIPADTSDTDINPINTTPVDTASIVTTAPGNADSDTTMVETDGSYSVTTASTNEESELERQIATFPAAATGGSIAGVIAGLAAAGLILGAIIRRKLKSNKEVDPYSQYNDDEALQSFGNSAPPSSYSGNYMPPVY